VRKCIPSAKKSVLRAFLQAALLRFGAFDRAARRQALVAEHAQGFDFGALAVAGTVFQHLDIARAGHAVFVGLLFLLRQGAPQHQQLADVLDRGGIQLVCQRLENHLATGAVIRLDTHLDEPMCVQRRIGLFFNRIGQAVRAEHDNGVEVVCFGAVVLALGGGKLYLSHASIIGAPGRWTIGAMKDTLKPAAKPGAKTGNKAAAKPVVKVDPRAGTKGKKLNKAWLHEHINDPYVKQAQRDGYRARAAYKLKEIDETLGLIKPGNCVVDLGSTPGAWSQYVRRKLSPTGAAAGALNGRIIALDLLPMEPIESVVFIQGDFREAEVLQKLEQTLASVNGPVPVDLVISDMAPNLSGIESADAARIAHLVELAVEFAQNRMKPDGALVVKLFHGSGYDELVKLFRATFKTVKPMKPKASRSNSSETFLVGMGLRTCP
jgi:23S rRNA (uridine2552-2'-O)-methyltransferase